MLLAQGLQVLIDDLAGPVVSEEVAHHALLALHRCEELLLILQKLEFAVALLQPPLLLVRLPLQLLHIFRRLRRQMECRHDGP